MSNVLAPAEAAVVAAEAAAAVVVASVAAETAAVETVGNPHTHTKLKREPNGSLFFILYTARDEGTAEKVLSFWFKVPGVLSHRSRCQRSLAVPLSPVLGCIQGCSLVPCPLSLVPGCLEMKKSCSLQYFVRTL